VRSVVSKAGLGALFQPFDAPCSEYRGPQPFAPNTSAAVTKAQGRQGSLLLDFVFFHLNVEIARNLPPLFVRTGGIKHEPHCRISAAFACSLALSVCRNWGQWMSVPRRLFKRPRAVGWILRPVDPDSISWDLLLTSFLIEWNADCQESIGGEFGPDSRM
jgi:hypothetical protein